MAWRLRRGKGSLNSALGAGHLHLADLLRDRDGALRHAEVQPLHHAAFDHDDAFLLVLGPAECLDDLARPLDLLLGRREDLVAWADLARVNQGLTVHAERAATLALLPEAHLVPELVVDSIDNVEAVGARGDQRHGKPRHDG